ncbi:MAG: hypothetical protein R3345_13630, partial [Fulvivirga sp.]|nr:hypothetical protein [Fulvivirga sp.]
SATGAFWGMLTGGMVTALLQANKITLSTTLSKDEVLKVFYTLGDKVDLSYIPAEALSPGKLINAINSAQVVTFEALDIYLTLPYRLDPNVFGISASAIVFILLSLMYPKNKKEN